MPFHVQIKEKKIINQITKDGKLNKKDKRIEPINTSNHIYAVTDGVTPNATFLKSNTF